jgi:acetylornithine deacetylase
LNFHQKPTSNKINCFEDSHFRNAPRHGGESAFSHGQEPLLIWNENKSKANLWATIGPSAGGGVILSGHTDTVSVDGQDWSTNPFALTERDGLLYGRGSCDMKGFLASVLALVPELVAAPLKRPVRIAFSHDEETGCVGVRSLIDYLRDHPPNASWCIVGEPTCPASALLKQIGGLRKGEFLAHRSAMERGR